METCKNCGGAHHIQRCQEILDLLFAPDEDCPPIGPDPEPGRRVLICWRGTARGWLRTQKHRTVGVR